MNRGLEPIAPPEPTAAIKPAISSYTEYAWGFWPYFRYNCIGSSWSMPFLWLILLNLHSIPDLLIGTLVASVFIVGAGFAISAFYWKFKRTKITSEQMWAHTFWGGGRWIRWETIERAQLINLPFAHYLRIRTTQKGPVIWLPLFHERQTEFERQIIQLAPPGNPLRSYFEAQRRAP